MKNESVNIDRIQELIISFAAGDFSKRAEISPSRDNTDTVVAGINMLGEELESITVSRDYFLSIFNTIADLLIIIDSQREITNVNDAVCQKLKLSREYIVGEKVGFLFRDDGEFDNRFHREKLKTSFETMIYSEDIKIPVRCSISKIDDNSQAEYVLIASDISFEKEVEKEILNTIITTEEKEKTRVAYDLHDSLGQELNAIRMYFDLAMQFKNNENRFDEVVNTCKQLVDQSIESVRKIAKDLMPKSLEDGELFSALKELSYSNSNFIKISNRLPEVEFSLETDEKVKIYRIIQEFFSNTMKHAEATQLDLTAWENSHCYYFQVNDNGKGFEREASKLGNGVRNIETRLKALNAEFTFTSSLKSGTSLIFQLKR